MEQTLGKRIVANRKRLKLTQDQLAERLGVTPQAVSKWENDQSCPDIATLPLLADIFGISLDELLGRTLPPDVAEPAEQSQEAEDAGFRVQKGDWEFTYDAGRRTSVGFAALVLLVGGLLLASKLLNWELGFWDILWPSALLVFGVCALFKRFSFFCLGCGLFGAYWLCSNLKLLPFSLGSELLFPALLLLFGLSLLVDALKKPKKPLIRFSHGRKHGTKGEATHDYTVSGDSFDWSASFGSYTQKVDMPLLAKGEASVSFGEYTLDLSGVMAVADSCRLEASCSFGELTLLVPRHLCVKHNDSAVFAAVETHGHPDPVPLGAIILDASVSFGEISIQYV